MMQTWHWPPFRISATMRLSLTFSISLRRASFSVLSLSSSPLPALRAETSMLTSHQIKQCQHHINVDITSNNVNKVLPALTAETTKMSTQFTLNNVNIKSNNANINKVFIACTYGWNIEQCQHQQGIYCLHLWMKHQTMPTSAKYCLH